MRRLAVCRVCRQVRPSRVFTGASDSLAQSAAAVGLRRSLAAVSLGSANNRSDVAAASTMLDSLLAEARHATPRHATPHRVMLRPPVTLLLVALRASMEAAAAAESALADGLSHARFARMSVVRRRRGSAPTTCTRLCRHRSCARAALSRSHSDRHQRAAAHSIRSRFPSFRPARGWCVRPIVRRTEQHAVCAALAVGFEQTNAARCAGRRAQLMCSRARLRASPAGPFACVLPPPSHARARERAHIGHSALCAADDRYLIDVGRSVLRRAFCH